MCVCIDARKSLASSKWFSEIAVTTTILQAMTSSQPQSTPSPTNIGSSHWLERSMNLLRFMSLVAAQHGRISSGRGLHNLSMGEYHCLTECLSRNLLIRASSLRSPNALNKSKPSIANTKHAQIIRLLIVL